jgi:hypothetical protein
MSKISVKKKGKMYECMAFFPSGFPKKWKYVRDLNSFAEFLTRDHSTWKYFNVYEKGTNQYLKRFYPGNVISKVLGLVLTVGIILLTQKFTSSQTTFTHSRKANLENTTSNKTTYSTSSNGFNNSATIPTSEGGTFSC